MGIGKHMAENLIILSNIEAENMKKKKKAIWHITNFYDDEDEDEMDEHYNDFFYDVIRYPPGSNPPSNNSHRVLCPYLHIY